MPKVTTVREKGLNFDLVCSDNLQEIFTDGVSEVMLGYPTSKVLFHTVTTLNTINIPEQRQAVFRMTMNTATLLEMCRNILAAAVDNKEQFPLMSQQFNERFIQILDDVEITPVPNVQQSSK